MASSRPNMSALALLTTNYPNSDDDDDDRVKNSAGPAPLPDDSLMKLSSLYMDDGENVKMLDEEEDILPPEPPGRCSKQLQDKINRLHERMCKENLDINDMIQKRKDFRNPSLYEKLLQYCNIDELGTNYPPSKYDPNKWGKESYYDELARLQRAHAKKKHGMRNEKTEMKAVSGVRNGNASNANRKSHHKKTKWSATSTKEKAPRSPSDFLVKK